MASPPGSKAKPCRGTADPAAAGRLALAALLLALALALALWLKRERLRTMYLRHRRREEIRHCRAYIAEHPDSEESAALQYKIARLFQESLRDHAQAIVEYKKFLDRHAAHPLAENAQYYLARSWEELGNLPRAQIEYGRLLRRHPGGLRENDARIRIEEIASRTGDNLAEDMPDDREPPAPRPAA